MFTPLLIKIIDKLDRKIKAMDILTRKQLLEFKHDSEYGRLLKQKWKQRQISRSQKKFKACYLYLDYLPKKDFKDHRSYNPTFTNLINLYEKTNNSLSLYLGICNKC